MAPTPRDFLLARRARKHGAKYALRIILEARRAGIPISLGFALVEAESNFTNVFGHDPSIFRGAGKVTRDKYLRYKRQRGPTGKGGMQGVGPCQLTWYSYQDQADDLGGCWKPRYNIQVGFKLLASLIKQHGMAEGIARYNGSGTMAQRYSEKVRRRQKAWHGHLT